MFKQLVLLRPVATFSALVTFVIAMALGFWQLDRMDQKLYLAADIAKKERSAPLLAHAKQWSYEEAKHHRMIARGMYIPDATVWLENRPHPQGRDPKTGITVGFYVLTPLRLQYSDQLIWINRGWVPRDGMDREKLPPLITPVGMVEVEGLVFEHPARVMNVGNLDALAQKQKIQQNLDIEKQSAQLNASYLPFILRQVHGGLDDGLQRDWAPMQDGSEKHKGYAFQWFSLATLTIFFWLFSGLLRKKV